MLLSYIIKYQDSLEYYIKVFKLVQKVDVKENESL